jgi:hypothetical protein
MFARKWKVAVALVARVWRSRVGRRWSACARVGREGVGFFFCTWLLTDAAIKMINYVLATIQVTDSD